jgi:glycosyltransferase involved in cell wall biosynthesis
MLRVLHIDTMKGWRGGERQAFYLAQGLLERGHDTGFACQPGSELERRLQDTGVRTHPVRFMCEADFTAAWRLIGLVRRHKYDILHMHDSHAHWLGGCAGRAAGRVLRVVSRRVDFSIHRHGFGLSIIKYRHFADAFVAVSEAVRKALVNDGVPDGMIHVVHSGVRMPGPGEDDRSALNTLVKANGSTRIVGSVGSLVGHKGHRYFVEAAAGIARRRPKVKFIILGEGRLRRDLEGLVRKHGLTDRFFLPGFTPSARKLTRALDVFVMPSVMEGLGTSLLDAMAAGVPVVASRAGGIPEVVQDGRTGLLTAPGDPQSLASAVERMLDDSSLARRTACIAREEVAREFTVDRMIEKTVDVYERLLAER